MKRDELLDNIRRLAEDIGAAVDGKPAPKPHKRGQLRTKRVDGVLYVRATDIADLCEIKGVLSNTVAALRKKADQ